MDLVLKFFWLIFFLSEVQTKSQSWDKECTKKFPDCDKGGKMHTNTACERRTCGPRFTGCIELPPDAEFRQAMLDYHNELRNKLASGKDTTGGNTNAANMMALSYDLGLEYTSICHVHGCKMKHDKCRGTEKFSMTSQNLAMDERGEPSGVTDELVQSNLKIKNYEDLVQGWYDEIKIGTFTDSIDNFKFEHKTGHFTALVWATTTHIGCARAVDRSQEKVKNEYTIHLTCNYAPGGNVIGGQMYKKGAGCSACPSGTKCNSKYTALCGEDNNDVIGKGANPFRTEDIARGGQDLLFSPNPYMYVVIFIFNIVTINEIVSVFQ